MGADDSDDFLTRGGSKMGANDGDGFGPLYPEGSLEARTYSLITQFNLISKRDENTLGLFFAAENGLSNLTKKYAEYWPFNQRPRTKRFLSQTRYLLKNMHKTRMGYRPLSYEIADTLSAFNSKTPEILDYEEREIKFYGQIIKEANMLALEHRITAGELVKDSQYRNEIFRRIFPNAEDFGVYMNIKVQQDASIGKVWLDSLRSLRPTLARTIKISPGGILAKHLMLRKIDRLPSSEIVDAYQKDELAFYNARASQIYGVNLAPSIATK